MTCGIFMANLHADGHCDGSNGIGGVFPQSGYSVVSIDQQRLEIPYNKTELTNNEAELLAIFHASFLANEGDTIFSDSQIAIGMAQNGQAKSKNVGIRFDLLAIATNFIITKKKLTIKWISREENLAT